MNLLAAISMMCMLSLFGCAHASASSDDFSNYLRARDALYEDHDLDAALKYVNAQLDKTPHNADALFLRARIYWSKENKSDTPEETREEPKMLS